jgi:hypothetical protein
MARSRSAREVRGIASEIEGPNLRQARSRLGLLELRQRGRETHVAADAAAGRTASADPPKQIWRASSPFMSGLTGEGCWEPLLGAKRPKTGLKTTENEVKTSHFEPLFRPRIEGFCRFSGFDPPTSNFAAQKTLRRAGSSVPI